MSEPPDMTNAEYQQLVEFLSRQFTAMHRRFDAIDGRFTTLEQGFDLGFREVFVRFGEVYHRLDRLDRDSRVIVETLGRIESLLVR